MLFLYAWAAAPYIVQAAIDWLSGALDEPPILVVLRKAALQVCGCG